jgi:hypothetical protein
MGIEAGEQVAGKEWAIDGAPDVVVAASDGDEGKECLEALVG